MAAYRRPWWVGRRWEVEALCKDGAWRAIYCGQTKAEVRELAAGWARDTGQLTRIVLGDGHPSRR